MKEKIDGAICNLIYISFQIISAKTLYKLVNIGDSFNRELPNTLRFLSANKSYLASALLCP